MSRAIDFIHLILFQGTAMNQYGVHVYTMVSIEKHDGI